MAGGAGWLPHHAAPSLAPRTHSHARPPAPCRGHGVQQVPPGRCDCARLLDQGVQLPRLAHAGRVPQARGGERRGPRGGLTGGGHARACVHTCARYLAARTGDDPQPPFTRTPRPQVLGIAGVDTRAITRRLRVDGCLNGVVTTDASIPGEWVRGGRSYAWPCAPLLSRLSSCAAAPCPHSRPPPPPPPTHTRASPLPVADAELLERSRSWSIVGKDLIKEVTCSEPYEWQDPTGAEWEFALAGERRGGGGGGRPGCAPPSLASVTLPARSPSARPLARPPAAKAVNGGEPFRVVAYDYGVKHNILRRLASFGCKVSALSGRGGGRRRRRSRPASPALHRRQLPLCPACALVGGPLPTPRERTPAPMPPLPCLR